MDVGLKGCCRGNWYWSESNYFFIFILIMDRSIF